MNIAKECSHFHAELELSNKEKHKSEKKCLQFCLKKVLTDLQEERELNKSLRRNQDEWKQQVLLLKEQITTKDKEIADVREQLHDVMFYLEAQDKLQHVEGVTQEEIQEGHVILGASGISQHKHTRHKKKINNKANVFIL